MSGQVRYNTSSILVGHTSLEGGTTETYGKTLSSSGYVAPVSSGYIDSLATKSETAIPSTIWSQTKYFSSETTSASTTSHWPPHNSLSSDLSNTYHATSSFSTATSLFTDIPSAPGLQSTAWSLWSSTSPADTLAVLSTSLLPDTTDDEHQHSGYTDTPSSTRDLLSTGWSSWSSTSPADTLAVLSTSLLPDTIDDEHQHSGYTDTSTRDLLSTGWSSWSSTFPVTGTVTYPSTIRSTSAITTVASHPVDPEAEHKSPFPTTHIETNSSARETESDLDVTSGITRHTTDLSDTVLPSSATRGDGFPYLDAGILTAAIDLSSVVSQTAAPSTRYLISISTTSFDLNSGGMSQYTSNSETATIYDSRSYKTTISVWSAGTNSPESWPSLTLSFTTAATDSGSMVSHSAGALQSWTNSAQPTSGGGQIQSIDDTSKSSVVLKRSAEISAGAVGASLCIIIGIFVWIRRVRQRGTIYVGMQQRQPDTSRFSFDT